MNPGRPARARRAAVLLLLVAVPACGREDDGPSAGAATAPSGPDTTEDLEPLVVDEVPSGLPRLPDDRIEPPAGAKRVEDVAGYADDPARERAVLRDYGYRRGWERFWGAGTGEGPQTGVSVDLFERPDGAAAYGQDLARNDAEHYGGMLSEGPPDLPDGCRRLRVDEPRPEKGLTGPAAFAWCTRGEFSVWVSAVAGSLDAASAEVREVMTEQLDRLPPG